MKTLIWVQHLLGMGHLMRAAALARALADKGIDTLLVSGGAVPSLVDSGAAKIATLPPCRAADVTFKVILDENDTPATDAWWADRADQLNRIVDDFDPDVLITETFPFGRRRFRDELLPVIESRRAAQPQTMIVASVRDILVTATPEKDDWMVEAARRNYDLILIHGDPKTIRFEDSFHRAADIMGSAEYTGYIVSASNVAAPPGVGKGEVIVSCGSGALGKSLFRATVDARALSQSASTLTWRMLAGYGIAQPLFDEISARAPTGMIIERARPDFMALLARARLSINLGGYNTIMDVISTGVPSVVVPISAEGETEQEQRAQLFAERGLVVCLPERDLTPQSLAAAADRAMTLTPPSHGIDTAGIDRSVDILVERYREWAGHGR